MREKTRTTNHIGSNHRRKDDVRIGGVNPYVVFKIREGRRDLVKISKNSLDRVR